MDINYLLLLQDFRNSIGGIFTDFLSKMTYLGYVNTLIVFSAAIYWCFNKSMGIYLLIGYGGNRLVNGFLKVTACAYRPWIRDARVIPEKEAIVTATGYSFPSGHSMNGATFFGGLSLRKELGTALRVASIVIAVLIAFSRNFLGVHTPQDVLVGLIVGTLVMWLIKLLLDWVEKKDGRDILVAAIGTLLGVAISLYAALKFYPVDYDAEGKLLVDGAKMANDTFKGTGWCVAILVGWVLERRFVNFSTDNLTMVERATRLIVGLLSYYAVSLILCPLIKQWIGGFAGTFVSCFVQLFYVMFLFPLVGCRQKVQGNNA